MWRKHRDDGFAVLGFPCDQFGHQEPGDEREIKEFCSLRYDVTFPLFAKIDVNGARAHPLYAWLKSEKAGVFGTEAIKWNFTKFLVDRAGSVVKRFAPSRHARQDRGRCECRVVDEGRRLGGERLSRVRRAARKADSRGRCSSRSGE